VKSYKVGRGCLVALTFNVTAVLPRDAMGTCCRRVLPVLVVLFDHLLELVLPVTVLAVLLLVLLSFTRHPGLFESLQFPDGALRLHTARLDVLQDRLLNVVAHAQQLVPRWYLRAVPPALQYLLDGGVAFLEVRAKAISEV
jgi:hypothetical protein